MKKPTTGIWALETWSNPEWSRYRTNSGLVAKMSGFGVYRPLQGSLAPEAREYAKADVGQVYLLASIIGMFANNCTLTSKSRRRSI
jgi:hypothetical protein